MEIKDHSRRANRPSQATSSGNNSLVVVLLIILNLFILSGFVLLFLQSDSQAKGHGLQLSKIEEKMDLLNSNEGTVAQRPNANTTGSSQSTTESSSETSTSEENQGNAVSNANNQTNNSGVGNATSNTENSTNVANNENNDNQHGVFDPNTQTNDNTASTSTTYVVQPGDSLSLIAEKHNMSLNDLMTKNGLTDTMVLVGEVLTVK